MQNDLEKSIKAWGVIQKNRMISRVVQMQLKDKVALQKRARNKVKQKGYKILANSIGFGLGKDQGVISRINFRFAKQGIWFEHGVGKNRYVGTSEANPHPFIGVVLNNSLDGLAILLAENIGDNVVDSISFFIPGIVDTKIKVKNG